MLGMAGTGTRWNLGNRSTDCLKVAANVASRIARVGQGALEGLYSGLD
jgi:hypothetical protein